MEAWHNVPQYEENPAEKTAQICRIKRLCLSLPGAVEIADRHGPWFNVGKKTFALFWAREKNGS